MKKQTSLHIATPCHEDWNGMTPSEKGKFCSLCSQQVVDFTMMSDTQILKYLSSHSGRLCGRFETEQLDRPLAEVTVPKKKNWYLALSLPLLLLFQKGTAQTKGRTTGAPSVITVQNKTQTGDTIRLGKMAPPPLAWITLHGTVLDETGAPISHVSVIEKGSQRGVTSDSAGRFSIQVPAGDSPVVLEASYIGYVSEEKKIDTKESAAPVVLTLTMQPVVLGEVVVGGLVSRRTGRMGYTASVCPKITRAEKADSSFRKLTGTSVFTVYPNPATAGSEVRLKIKKEGHYELQLLDNSSTLLKTEIVSANGNGSTASFFMPASLAAGVYYLRLIDTDGGKSFLEKVVVK